MNFLEIFKACLGIKGEGGLSNIMIQENTSFMDGSLCIHYSMRHFATQKIYILL